MYRRDSWQLLADHFNDYTKIYENVCGKGKSLPNIQVAFDICGDLDPCMIAGYIIIYHFIIICIDNFLSGDLRRPSRDVSWLKKISQEIRTTTAKVMDNYNRSGSHDAEDVYLEFSKYYAGSLSIFYLPYILTIFCHFEYLN